MEKEKKPSRGSIIIGRMAMIGEDLVPEKEFEKLTGEQYQIFMTEPDLNQWPPEMNHLKEIVRKIEAD